MTSKPLQRPAEKSQPHKTQFSRDYSATFQGDEIALAVASVYPQIERALLTMQREIARGAVDTQQSQDLNAMMLTFSTILEKFIELRDKGMTIKST
jgi:hypothetical protein